jgi:hypothetical protein
MVLGMAVIITAVILVTSSKLRSSVHARTPQNACEAGAD